MRILLVEDEKLELETLRDYVDWKKLGIEKVYTARNGRSALECMAEHEPDIMITDIQMPVMNGIELTQRVRGEGYKSKIIFLTGYDDFEYVKAAFSVNAVDYILKPFGVEEVENLIRRVSAQILKERMAADSLRLAAGKLLEQACTSELEEDKLEALSEMHFGRPASEAAFGMLAVYGETEGEEEETLLQQPEVLHVFEAAPFLFVLLRGHVQAKDAAIRVSRFLKGKSCVIWSGDKISLSGLRAKTVLMQNRKEGLFYQQPGSLLCLEETPAFQAREVSREALHEKRRKLRACIMAAKEEEAREALADCLDELSACTRETCQREAYGIYLNLNNRLVMEDAQLLEYMQSEERKTEPALVNTAFFSEISLSLVEYTQNLCSFFNKQMEDPNYYVIAWVKDYVAKNYAGVCSVEDMAEGLHLSPNYLRSLFKTGTGLTILEYLTDFRMEKACGLLKDKTLKVREISRLTGYENVSWFSQLFVKKYGVTPNEYRKMV